MYKNKTFLAVIPARGGSKRLPRKNILPLNGKPLIGWSIEAAILSQYIDKVIVSSDDDEILEIAKKFDADIIKRPSNLATDEASTYDAVEHAVKSIEKYDYIVLLQPTSPLRKSSHIDEAIESLVQKESNSIVSVCEMDHSPLWSNTLPKDLSMSNFIKKEISSQRSQDLSVYYRINGALYIVKTEEFYKEKTFFLKNKSFAYKMDRKDSIDIDELIDFKIAQIFLSESLGSN